jgi:hypothetical protein
MSSTNQTNLIPARLKLNNLTDFYDFIHVKKLRSLKLDKASKNELIELFKDYSEVLFRVHRLTENYSNSIHTNQYHFEKFKAIYFRNHVVFDFDGTNEAVRSYLNCFTDEEKIGIESYLKTSIEDFRSNLKVYSSCFKSIKNGLQNSAPLLSRKVYSSMRNYEKKCDGIYTHEGSHFLPSNYPIILFAILIISLILFKDYFDFSETRNCKLFPSIISCLAVIPIIIAISLNLNEIQLKIIFAFSYLVVIILSIFFFKNCSTLNLSSNFLNKFYILLAIIVGLIVFLVMRYLRSRSNESNIKSFNDLSHLNDHVSSTERSAKDLILILKNIEDNTELFLDNLEKNYNNFFVNGNPISNDDGFVEELKNQIDDLLKSNLNVLEILNDKFVFNSWNRKVSRYF